MSSTKAIGVRLPLDLIELVKMAEPGKTFTEIVRGALQEKYSFTDSKNIANIRDIHSKVDRIIGSVQEEVD